VEEIRRSWGWILALGILVILFGVVCIVGDVTATFATVLAFGWLLLGGGVALGDAFYAVSRVSVAMKYIFGNCWQGLKTRTGN
jgi:uncharacterized membrane protein HdeD (DUF308 family)